MNVKRLKGCVGAGPSGDGSAAALACRLQQGRMLLT
jgi:hypothetical protein